MLLAWGAKRCDLIPSRCGILRKTQLDVRCFMSSKFQELQAFQFFLNCKKNEFDWGNRRKLMIIPKRQSGKYGNLLIVTKLKSQSMNKWWNIKEVGIRKVVRQWSSGRFSTFFNMCMEEITVERFDKTRGVSSEEEWLNA